MSLAEIWNEMEIQWNTDTVLMKGLHESCCLSFRASYTGIYLDNPFGFPFSAWPVFPLAQATLV